MYCNLQVRIQNLGIASLPPAFVIDCGCSRHFHAKNRQSPTTTLQTDPSWPRPPLPFTFTASHQHLHPLTNALLQLQSICQPRLTRLASRIRTLTRTVNIPSPLKYSCGQTPLQLPQPFVHQDTCKTNTPHKHLDAIELRPGLSFQATVFLSYHRWRGTFSSTRFLKDGRRGTELSNLEVHTVSIPSYPWQRSVSWRACALHWFSEALTWTTSHTASESC
jgi:hypothetical protein